ncbi:UV DNA damage repair endonuclease UvsE [Guptibacillus algicola]|uniref:UV DNA damage repair endonuclease UvsE n=1 Tax=Guptibacillus algicola TaxID=225844 RepID=UPI001CD78482|nr:UV DNA damage repair endonuclease UvsE [Alkalihalobacillus algicola]MCA0989509.1 UV DNA damage repair endonuclease UvsE [Alkalihalobacillus algicola]
MTIIRLGYVAMSMELTNSSPSQTMTFKQFQKLSDREAGIRKLERIAKSNLENCLRLLKHNKGNDISFFRFSSRLIPLANHEALEDWNYLSPLKEELKALGDFAKQEKMRVDFHPDHFVLLNTPKKETLKASTTTLAMHVRLLEGMGIDPTHRCVLHVGGGYNDKEKALERFIHNWMYTPKGIQDAVMLENDDTTFTMIDTLYLCEKLGIPLVFDYHHHLACHNDEDWEKDWERVVSTWDASPLPVKMHISSPKGEKDFRSHADYIDIDMFFTFLKAVQGSTSQIDCMIEAKKKDQALFKLMEEIKKRKDIEIIDRSTFRLK